MSGQHANSFFLYCGEHRAKLAEDNPGKENSEITSMLGVLWRSMSRQEKMKYTNAAKKQREDYKKKNPNSKGIRKEHKYQSSFKIQPYSPTKIQKKEPKPSTEPKSQAEFHTTNSQPQAPPLLFVSPSPNPAPQIIASEIETLFPELSYNSHEAMKSKIN